MIKKLQCITLIHLLVATNRVIGIKYYPNAKIQSVVDSFTDVEWSDKENMYYIKNTSTNLKMLFDRFKGVAWVNGNQFFEKKHKKSINPILSLDYIRKREIDKNYRKCPEEYLQKLELERYAANTAKTYISCFETFINYFKEEEDLKRLNELDIKEYLMHLSLKQYSHSYMNQAVNSIKFYYEIVLGMPNRFYSLERPRKKSSLPKVISKEEVGMIIKNTNNIKHKCIVSVLYSAGLRRSELINLKIIDIDSKRMIITIKDSKGGKDRNTLLSQHVLGDLRKYFIEWKPKVYLFEGPKEQQYSPSSISKIVKNASKKAGIRKNVTPHTLRHSFATHLLEAGTNLRYIQEILGHNSSRTTEIYTYVATNNIQNIKSPIDSLF